MKLLNSVVYFMKSWQIYDFSGDSSLSFNFNIHYRSPITRPYLDGPMEYNPLFQILFL
jgi:hypothetical protein